MSADTAPSESTIPAGFKVLPIFDGFIGHNGPLYVRNDDELVFGFRVEPHMCNIVGICHGGWIASALDIVMPVTARLRWGLERTFVLTVNLSIDYLGSASLGSWVEGRAEVLRRTKRMVFVQGNLSIEGELIARGSGILRIAGEAPLIEI